MTEAVEESGPTTHEVAHVLAEIGTLMELNGRDSFRARAFVTAARSLDGVTADLRQLVRENRLSTLRGVGAGIAGIIREYVESGRSRLHDELRSATPPGLYDLMRVPGLGTKRIRILHESLGIDGLDALESAARAGRIAELPGFGARTQDKVLAGIPFARSTRQRRRYPEALEAAARLVDWIRSLPHVQDAFIAGQLRRRLEVVDSIDVVVVCEDADAVLNPIGMLGAPGDVPPRPGEATIRLSDGIFVHLRCAVPEELASVLLWETGSPTHLDAMVARAESLGWRLDYRGLWIDGELDRVATEEDLYDRLGLAFVPPELREEAAILAETSTPAIRLVELSDLRGTFHCHTTYSDGKSTLLEMAEAAREHGWQYLGIADHSQSASYAGGLDVASVRRQWGEIRAINRHYEERAVPFRLFAGIESDILTDGSLDYPSAVLEGFDYVVGSVHGSFGMREEEMTRRIVTAIQNPHLTILGHPTGRLLLTREGYDLDIDAVLHAAAAARVVIEINANPHRLDLDWRDVRIAAELGILIAVNPDAHSVNALDHVVFGIHMARKAGLAKEQILNTWPVEEIVAYFAQRKRQLET